MTLLRSFLFSFLAAGLLVSVTPAHAETTVNNAIAVVNIQEIMRDSLAAKSIKDQFDAKQKAFQSEISTKEQDLQKEQQELKKQQSVLSQDAFEKKLREFNTKASSVQKEVQNKKLTLDKGLAQSFAEIQKTVGIILGDMSKEKGFLVVLPSQQILYSDAKLDITQEVLTRLNKALTKVNVVFDSAPAAAKK